MVTAKSVFVWLDNDILLRLHKLSIEAKNAIDLIVWAQVATWAVKRRPLEVLEPVLREFPYRPELLTNGMYIDCRDSLWGDLGRLKGATGWESAQILHCAVYELLECGDGSVVDELRRW